MKPWFCWQRMCRYHPASGSRCIHTVYRDERSPANADKTSDTVEIGQATGGFVRRGEG
jgi:hypothetical protein